MSDGIPRRPLISSASSALYVRRAPKAAFFSAGIVCSSFASCHPANDGCDDDASSKRSRMTVALGGLALTASIIACPTIVMGPSYSIQMGNCVWKNYMIYSRTCGATEFYVLSQL